MKRMSKILYSFCLLTLLLLTACGKDNNTSGTSSGTSSLVGGSCSCTATYSPVCGANDITYDNICIANCYKVTETLQGNCICTERPVCGDNGRTYTECDAQAAIRNGQIKKIVKFSDCRSATY
jgi:hypothetical protein